MKQSNLFTLNEAMPEEEANTFTDDNGNSPVAKKSYKEPNSVRHEPEKLRRMTSSENVKPSKLSI